MSRDEIETRPRPPSIRTHQSHRSARSVRGTNNRKSSGYDNPLYTSGDVLVDKDGGDVVPMVVGDHVVVTPRNPESPLVAKLKARAAEKNQRLREDRILNSTATSASSSNPFFPPSTSSNPRAIANDSSSPSYANSLSNPRLCPSHSPRPSASPRTTPHDHDEDNESLDSIVLDDSPAPIRVGTPGGVAHRRAFGGDFGAPEPDTEPRTPEAATAACTPGENAAAEKQDSQGKNTKSDAESEALTGAEVAAAPHDTPPIAAAGGSRGADHAAARPATPPQDKALKQLLGRDMASFVMTPGPLLEPLQCYIIREKASGGLLSKAPHCYKLYLEEGDVFLMAAQRRERTKCPSYVLSLNENELKRDGTGYCGKLKSNFIGTEFQILDSGQRRAPRPQRAASFIGGLRPGAAATALGLTSAHGPAGRGSGGSTIEDAERPSSGTAQDGNRSELGLVQYHMNVMGTKGPRKMVVGIPYVDCDSNKPVKWSGDSMMPRLKKESDTDMIKLVNKVPKWNSSLGAYCLNFNGRVTQASVKNFQLVSEGDDHEREVLQFGRVADNRFTMDYAWPLSVYQAFSICITSLDSKLACE